MQILHNIDYSVYSEYNNHEEYFALLRAKLSSSMSLDLLRRYSTGKMEIMPTNQPDNTALLSVFIPAICAMITAVVTIIVDRFLTRRSDAAKAGADDGSAAKMLSEAAKIQIETYTQAVIEPLRAIILSKDSEVNVLRAQMVRLNNDNIEIRKELEHERKCREESERSLREELIRTDSALHYLVKNTRNSFPHEVDVAMKIRSGELSTEQP